MLPVTTTENAADTRRAVLHRHIRLIVGFTIAYNAVEAAVAWQFTRKDSERFEKPTLRVIAISFFLLAAYVTASAALAFGGVIEPEHSTVGLVLTAVIVIVMPSVSLLEQRTGRELGSATAVADSKQTLICAYLSAAVLIGLALNSLLG